MAFETCQRELDKKHAVYTPFVWVEECHSCMNRIFGKSWYDQVVWDLSCGEKAMTKDHAFSKLYSSDIDASVEPDFIYDAMTLDESKMPESLVQAFKSRTPVIIFTNTPFGVVGERIRKMVAEIKEKYDAMVIFACITNLFMNSRHIDYWLDNFHYLYGFMFESTEFPDLKAEWPVLFSVWVSKNEGEL